MSRPRSGSPFLALLLLLLGALVVGLPGCSAARRPGAVAAEGTPPPVATHSSEPAVEGVTTGARQGDPYAHLARMFHQRGVDVWFEADLVARWLEGPAAFHTAIDRLAALARVPGTVGFKIADELGYGDGLDSPGQVIQFLRAARRALSRSAPHARLLVDAIVPEIGCLPWLDSVGETCAAAARRAYPGASLATTERYLRLGLVDDLDLSTGLLEDTAYAARGLTRRRAQESAWRHVSGWGWPELVGLRGRKALAQPHGYAGTEAQATDDVGTFVDVPQSQGALGVDVWTWRQAYDGSTYSLLDDQLDPNPLWTLLLERHAAGVPLLTHATPSTLPTAPEALARECDVIAQVFDAVFVAAGTG